MKALLALEDGFVLEGESFTGPIELAGGEVVFHTTATGYQELITNPSCAGQMVCMTWPLIGNYGVNEEDRESDRVQAAALLVKACCKEPSNWRATDSLPSYLAKHNVPGIEGLDTRALTLHIRKNGAMRGAISTSLSAEELVAAAKNMPALNGSKGPDTEAKLPYAWNAEDGCLEGADFAADGSYAWKEGKARVVVYDYGVRWSLLRTLSNLGCDLLMVPPCFSLKQLEALQPDGVFLSGGPGDPAARKEEVTVLRDVAERYPVAAVGLGYQLLALACGASTARLPFGHHGVNHPVKNLITGKVEIANLHHDFHVVAGGSVEATHLNLNDNTVAGFRVAGKPLFGVQHAPEGASGFEAGQTFLDAFMAALKK